MMLKAALFAGLVAAVVADATPRAWRSAVRVLGGSGDEPSLPEDDAVDSLFGGSGSGAGMPGGMPEMPTSPEAMAEQLKNIENYSKMMEGLMKSPEMEEFFSDEEKIEEARQAILNNPMMMELLGQVPGANLEALRDPKLWKEQMLQAKELFDMQKSLFDKGEAPADSLDED